MNSETATILIALLIVLVALLQFLLQAGPQTRRVQDLERRLAEAEARLEAIWQRWWLPPTE